MNFENISASACKKIIDEEGGNISLIDVRTPGEYAQAKIAGSKNIPLNEINDQLDELAKEEKIIIYCASGNRSGVACSILSSNGFDNSVNMSGGIFAWMREGFEVE